MRRAALILLLILTLAISSAGYLANVLYQPSPPVTITAETVYGDPSYLDGVTLELYTVLENRLFWDITYEPATGNIPETKYSYRTIPSTTSYRRPLGNYEPSMDIPVFSRDATLRFWVEVQNAHHTLIVSDAESEETLQVLPLQELPGSYSRCTVRDAGDFLVLFFYDLEKVVVLVPDANGKYQMDFLSDLADDGYFFFPPLDSAMAYDGERLIFSAPESSVSPTVDLSVYTADGLVYHGRYQNSQTSHVGFLYSVKYSYENPLRIHIQKK